MNGLSGAAYVAAFDRSESQQPGGLAMWVWRQGTCAIPIAAKREACYGRPRKPGVAGHDPEKICKYCAHTWNWDYQLLLWRTAGGRKLAESLWKSGLDMGQFHGYVGIK